MATTGNFKTLLALALVCGVANAATVFNFDADNLGTATSFTDTVGGLSATFSSSADPGGFVIYPSMFETLTGNVLGDPGPAGMDNLLLNVNFNQDLSAIVFDFATFDYTTPSPLTLTAFENNTPVGGATLPGQFLTGFTFPEGEIAFSGANFNKVVVSSAAPDFAVDNITVVQAAATAPEPGTLTLLGAGLVLAGGIGMRRRRAIKP